MKEDGDENHQAKPRTDQKCARNGHTIEERVQQEAYERGCAGDRTDRVCLFAEVKVRREGVLREMHRQVSCKNQNGRRRCATAQERLRQELDDGNRQHETGAERKQMFDHLELERRTPGHRERAQDIAGGGN